MAGLEVVRPCVGGALYSFAEDLVTRFGYVSKLGTLFGRFQREVT